jgi:hypothetical protein
MCSKRPRANSQNQQKNNSYSFLRHIFQFGDQKGISIESFQKYQQKNYHDLSIICNRCHPPDRMDNWSIFLQPSGLDTHPSGFGSSCGTFPTDQKLNFDEI